MCRFKGASEGQGLVGPGHGDGGPQPGRVPVRGRPAARAVRGVRRPRGAPRRRLRQAQLPPPLAQEHGSLLAAQSITYVHVCVCVCVGFELFLFSLFSLRLDSCSAHASHVGDILRDTFREIDLEMREFEYEGCTCTAALLCAAGGKRYLLLANVGDSSAFLWYVLPGGSRSIQPGNS